MGWVIAGAAVLVMVIVDWLIVMGINPRNWRGGGQDDRGK